MGVRAGKVRSASIAEAKEQLSALVRTVEERNEEIVLQRRGKPVAKIIPIRPSDLRTPFGCMKGSAIILGDIDGPTGEEWDVTDED